ncbi:NUDIX hydrolase [Sphingosinithalassobacter sp. LHW66-3]|uniref:NUDIX hydrolase n=1 Tax=Sphingosinithalassobacter sp. LHW66-3 TaxID=3424718 RepID=UPI003D6C6270
MGSPSEIVPAATVVVIREASGGAAPELLMVERARAMSFAGGALVFPGGRVDPADRVLAAQWDGDQDDIAARIAAVRESLEETGLAPGLSVPAERIPRMRAELAAGATFGELLRDHAATLDPHALVPFARWCPDHDRRVFDTYFYLARAPAEGPEPTPDATESVRVFWATARQVLAEADAGRARIIFPTRRNLERLATFGSFDEAAAHARAHPVRTITPWVERRDDADHLCIPNDCGYPVTSEAINRATRG